jgi:thiol-disulfide isomerase/thioredoxin
MRRSLAIGLTVVIALLGACTGDDDAAPDDRVEVPDDADRTSVEFVGFDDQVVTLDDYHGRPLLVNLFASWCAPCVSEMPTIERVKQDVGDQVAFLGIAVNDRVEDAQALIDRTGITWDLARDPQGELTTELGAVGMPTTFLITPEGEIVEQHTGALEEDELRDLLRDKLGVNS